MKLKNTDLFLLRHDENVEKFMEDENSITEEEINKALRAAGYGYHSIKEFNSC
jgi:site-specific DNA-cytosine methylase